MYNLKRMYKHKYRTLPVLHCDCSGLCMLVHMLAKLVIWSYISCIYSLLLGPLYAGPGDFILLSISALYIHHCPVLCMLVYTLYKIFLSVVNIHHVLQSTSYQLYMFTIVLHYICWSICFHISSYQLCIFIHPVFCPFYACPCTCVVRLISCVYSPLFWPMFASSCSSQVRLIGCIYSPLFCHIHAIS